MKKLISLLLLLLITVTVLSACQSDKKEEATEAETIAETQAPTEASTEAADESGQTSEPVDASWFDDAVFIGDSVTVALDYACEDDKSLLGDAKFVCAQSLGYHNALWDLDAEYAVHPTYEGETILAETAAEKTGANKVFIMLGVNDIGTYGAEDTMEQAKLLAERILENSPDVTLYFQSTTPMIADKESDWLNNDKITAFNDLLEAYCDEQGYYYLDVYHQVCDDSGALNPSYCNDPDVQGIHFTVEGCTVWADYLKSSVGKMPTAAEVTEAPATEEPTEEPAAPTEEETAAPTENNVSLISDSASSSEEGGGEVINYYVPDE